MRIQTFVIGSVLALALFLFAQKRPETSQPGGFREVVDLTHSLPTPGSARRTPPIAYKPFPWIGASIQVASVTSSEQFATRMDAPSRLVQGSVDGGSDSGRPLSRATGGVGRKRQRQKQSRLRNFSRRHRPLGTNQRPDSAGRGGHGTHRLGIPLELPPRAIATPMPGASCTSPDIPKTPPAFLPKDAMLWDWALTRPTCSTVRSKTLAVNQYTLAHGLYVLTNVANLDRMPANGAVAMVAPNEADRRIRSAGAHSGVGAVARFLINCMPSAKPHAEKIRRALGSSSPPRQITQEAFEFNPQHLRRLVRLHPGERAEANDLWEYTQDLLYTEIRQLPIHLLAPILPGSVA